MSNDDVLKLEKEIEAKKAELARAKKKLASQQRDLAIKKLEEYTPEEKISFFDSIYKSALSMLVKKKKGESNEDDETYTWEEVMEILARERKVFWKYYNSND